MNDPPPATMPDSPSTSASAPVFPSAASAIAFAPPPPPFLATPGTPAVPWLTWKRSFRTFLQAAGCEDLPDERKKAILLSNLGFEGQRLYYDLASQADPATATFEDILRIFDRQYEESTNPLVHRIIFRDRRQQPGESFQDFVTALQRLAPACAFGVSHDESLRDQILQGVASARIRERLLYEGPSLTLQKAEDIGKNIEQVHQELKVFNGSPVHRVSTQRQDGGKSRSGDASQLGSRTEFREASQDAAVHCFRCGSTHHIASDPGCPAKRVTCRACKKVGHYATVCRSRNRTHRQSRARAQLVSSTTETESASTVSSVLTIQASKSRPATIYAEVLIANTALKLLVDTGATVSLMNSTTYEELFKVFPLSPSSIRLKNYSEQEILHSGHFSVVVKYRNKAAVVTFHVTNQGTSLLGLDAIQALGIDIQGSSLSCQQVSGIPADPSVQPSSPPHNAPTEFSHLFSGQFGLVKGFIHDVRLRASVQPVSAKLRPLPLVLREQVSSELHRLESADIIERVSASEWISPLVVVRKKDNSIRLCVDLREPNKAIVIDAFPLPRADELLHRLADATVFSKLDLQSAYYQVLLSEKSRELTTFITHDGLFRFKRVCFGLASAPSAFQQIMSSVLKDCPGTLCYLDDVLVWGNTQHDHDSNLQTVLSRISNAGMQLNHKCVFSVPELTFLGHKISANSISPMDNKIQAIVEAPQPNDKKALHSFLGLTGYYAKFIPQYADLVEPLRKLLRQGQPFVWDQDTEYSFQSIKEVLASCPVVRMFQPHLPIVVTVDASDVGLGAVLQQKCGNELFTVAFASRTLTSAERRYSVGEREALACLFACEHWHVYLWGRQFTLRTDHQALVTLLSSKGPGHRPLRITRWSARLLYYNFDIEYCKGDHNVIADALSRLPVPPETEPVQEEEIVSFITACITKEELQTATKADPVCQAVKNSIVKGWRNAADLPPELQPYAPLQSELSYVDNLLLRGECIVPPASLRARLLSFAHEGHLGITKTKLRLRGIYWWPQMDRQVEDLVRSCFVCQKADKSAKPTAAPFQPVEWPLRPWEKVAIDIIGPIDQAPQHARFAVVLVDYHSKWPEVGFMSSVTSEAVMRFLIAVFSREGFPDAIVSDNGSQFVSHEFRNFLKERGIKHFLSSLYYPQANGQVERFNRVLKEYIQVAVLERRELTSAVLEYLAIYRFSPHMSTGVSPAMLLHSRQPRTRLDVAHMAPIRPEFASSKLRQEVRERVIQKQRKTKAYVDQRRGAKRLKLQPGDLVKVRNSRKTGPKYLGPFRIQRQIGQSTFQLENGKRYNASKLVKFSARQNSRERLNEESQFSDYSSFEDGLSPFLPVPTGTGSATHTPFLPSVSSPQLGSSSVEESAQLPLQHMPPQGPQDSDPQNFSPPPRNAYPSHTPQPEPVLRRSTRHGQPPVWFKDYVPR